MSRVLMNIAGGYLRTTVQDTIEKHPQLSVAEATEVWVKARYGGWIEKNLEGHYVIGDVTENSFSIIFDNPNDEDIFLRDVGGRVVPLEVADGE
ncbi:MULTISPECIES: hypothetical protein [unclassified Rhizobium]|uniref:hypothetical protein n=1 Tax=unclassified Rhizobium TaxID=2613769 RepID=UPI00115F4820|nr:MULTISPECIES: hypothetical protein [unclassified Rhizobium]TQX90261.1 hypothetical protein EQW76_11195 [Rhizobium sp. rho-13.1]TQY16211.1 hypothetical protein EQW74_10785 [Rhizobium sp. rho-1.1]